LKKIRKNQLSPLFGIIPAAGVKPAFDFAGRPGACLGLLVLIALKAGVRLWVSLTRRTLATSELLQRVSFSASATRLLAA
jgi:hypothetical protein